MANKWGTLLTEVAAPGVENGPIPEVLKQKAFFIDAELWAIGQVGAACWKYLVTTQTMEVQGTSSRAADLAHSRPEPPRDR